MAGRTGPRDFDRSVALIINRANDECGRLMRKSEFDGNYCGQCEKIRADGQMRWLNFW